MLLKAPIAPGLAEEFCITQALIIISGRGRSSCAMILFRSRICASSPGFVSENTNRSGGDCSPADMATATDCIPMGAFDAGVTAAGGAGDGGAAAVGGPHAPVFPRASPAIIQGVVSELI